MAENQYSEEEGCYGVAASSFYLSSDVFAPTNQSRVRETPGIQHFGRIVVLLVPSTGDESGPDHQCLNWRYRLQNVANIFLLSPLVFQPSGYILVEEPQTGLVLQLCYELQDWMRPSSVRSLVWCQSCLWLDDLDQYLRVHLALFRLSVLQSTIASKMGKCKNPNI